MASVAEGTITTERDDILLRPYGTDMTANLVAVANHEEIARYMSDRFPYPYTQADAESWIAFATSQDPVTSYAVIVDGSFVGGVGAEEKDGELSGTFEMGWWLTPSAWHKGILAVAGRALLDEVFSSRGAMRIEAPVMDANPNSGRVAEKIGMVLECTSPSRYVKHGVRYDQLMYGITRERWEASR
ncbi:MAG: GNAT family N-acetyltransferase [Acidimicrobiia bacterium]